MRICASVAFEAKKPLQVVEIDIEGPRAGDVLVEIVVIGICCTDVDTLAGFDGEGPLPLILGCTGVVRDIGTGVNALKLSEHVVPLCTSQCRQPNDINKGFNLMRDGESTRSMVVY